MNAPEVTKLKISGGEKIFSPLSRSIRRLREEYERTYESWLETVGQLDLTVSELNVNKEKLSSEIRSGEMAAKELSSLKVKSAKLLEEYKTLVAAFKAKKQEVANLQGALSGLRDAKTDLDSRYELVCSAISPIKMQSDQYLRFKEILDGQLLPLINRINVVANEAQQVIKIRAIEDELRLIDSLSVFSNRSVVAVAGGFSSGKSSLITSLFANEDVSLPIGIEPVTAIPTYVFHSDDVAIKGYPNGGGIFDVSAEMYARLSHKFVEEFGFNLRDLLPFMSLEVPLQTLKHIAFIDLPGYNPGDRDGATGGDLMASDEFVTQGEALLWVIGMDANGTVPRDDLEQLWSLSELDIPIYVVLNKADLRPLATLDEVLDQVCDELSMNGIAFEGISAYSSECGGELAFREKSLFEVLESWDKPRDSAKVAAGKLFNVIDEYESAITHDIERRKTKASLVKALELNLLEVGAFEVDDAEAFDTDKYMKAAPKKKKGKKAKKEDADPLVGGSLMASSIRRHFLGIAIGSDDSDDDEVAGDSEVNQGGSTSSDSSGGVLTNKADLIDIIRDQLQDLRLDYSTSAAEKDLAELSRIRDELSLVF